VTKEIKRIDLPNLEGFHCFACGSHNPIGLHMSFYLEDDTVCSDIVLNENHAGWDSVAHGGIVTTLLVAPCADERMGFIHSYGNSELFGRCEIARV